MLEFLPSYGHYKSQLVMDEEWAEIIVDREEQDLASPPAEVVLDEDLMSPLGYTPEVGRLDLVLDRLQALEIAVLWTANPKEQPAKITPMPRPDTALDRAREKRTRSLLDEVDAMFRGDELVVLPQ